MRRGERPGLTLALLAALAAALSSADSVADCEPLRDDDARRKAEQKTVLLARLLDDAALVQRIEQSGNPDAVRALSDAQARVAAAGSALSAGCDRAAADIADEGLALATRASRLAKSDDGGNAAGYRELSALAASYLENLRSQPDAGRGIDAAGLAGIERQLARAGEIAIAGRFAEAVTLLEPVVDRLERRLVAIYDRQTVFYEKSFADPAEEYAYLVEQYRGYRLALDRFGNHRSPPYRAAQSYAENLAEATRLSGQADAQARAGDLEGALGTMRDAVAHCERALKLIGLGY